LGIRFHLGGEGELLLHHGANARLVGVANHSARLSAEDAVPSSAPDPAHAAASAAAAALEEDFAKARDRLNQLHALCLGVAAQVEFENKVRKRFVVF